MRRFEFYPQRKDIPPKWVKGKQVAAYLATLAPQPVNILIGRYNSSLRKNNVRHSSVNTPIFSVTDEPARNIADTDTNVIKLLEPEFVYVIPSTEDCEFKVKFYKGFVFVKYIKGSCLGHFGHNATIEGIYLKTE